MQNCILCKRLLICDIFSFFFFSHSSAPSQHDAQLLAIGHQTDLFRLAVDQRYAHEYGDSCVTEVSTLAAAANCSSCGCSETSQGQSPETSADWHKDNLQKTKLSQSDIKLWSADCVQTQSEKEPVQAPNLKMYDSHTQYFSYSYSIFWNLKVRLILAKGNQNKAHL